MAFQRRIPGGPFVTETGTRQARIPGGPFLSETFASDTPTDVNCTSGTIVNAGAASSISISVIVAAITGNINQDGLASSISFGNTVGCTAASLSLDGAAATILVTTTVSCTTGNLNLAGLASSIAVATTFSTSLGILTLSAVDAVITNDLTTITTQPIINNTGTILSEQAVSWSWMPSGRIGSLDSVTIVDGTGTTETDGTLIVEGLFSGDGILMVAVLNTSAEDDAVYYEAGTVA